MHDALGARWVRSSLAALVFLMIIAGDASADWRYCYAMDAVTPRFYMSSPFQVADFDTMGATESAFRRFLTQTRVRAFDIGCPRADSEVEIRTMMTQAMTYQRSNGNNVIPLAWMLNNTAARSH